MCRLAFFNFRDSSANKLKNTKTCGVKLPKVYQQTRYADRPLSIRRPTPLLLLPLQLGIQSANSRCFSCHLEISFF